MGLSRIDPIHVTHSAQPNPLNPKSIDQEGHKKGRSADAVRVMNFDLKKPKRGKFNA